MWKWLFIVSYVWAGLFVGGWFHNEYIARCMDDKPFARSILTGVLWPLTSLISMSEGPESKCKEGE